MRPVIRAVLLLIVIGGLVAAALIYSVARTGLSARVPPSAVEERLALAMRWLATPAAVRSRPNPIAPSAAVIDEAVEHFADHCASCHANDGSGSTQLGRNVYPPAPDMREARTQDLSDGELFTVIENGIRLTAMPAWGTGTPEGERASWGLVHFIRQLPTLTPEVIARMEQLNPKSPAQFREEEETRRFLAGEDPAPAPAVSTPTSHQGRHD